MLLGIWRGGLAPKLAGIMLNDISVIRAAVSPFCMLAVARSWIANQCNTQNNPSSSATECVDWHIFFTETVSFLHLPSLSLQSAHAHTHTHTGSCMHRHTHNTFACTPFDFQCTCMHKTPPYSKRCMHCWFLTRTALGKVSKPGESTQVVNWVHRLLSRLE